MAAMMLEIVLTSSVLILIILLLRAFCRKRIKPTLRYALWLIVAVRLILPFSLFSSNASVMNFFGKAGIVELPAQSADITPSAPTDIVNDTPAVDGSDDAYTPEDIIAPEVLPPLEQGYTDQISSVNPADKADISLPENPSAPINPTEPDSQYIPPVQDYHNTPEPAEAPAAQIERIENENVQPAANPEIITPERKQLLVSVSLFGRSIEIQPWVVNAVRAVWLAIAAVMGLWFFGVNIAFSLSLRRNRRKVDIKAPLRVYSVQNLDSPCLFGLFRPAVYVNEKTAGNEDSLRFVLAHEYCHFRHGDMVWSILRCVLLSVYWFNPLVWAAAHLSKRDCECSCDEAAIKLLGEPSRISYGKALVSMIPERRADPRLIGVASTSMSGSKRAVRERVKLIARKPKNTVIAVVLIIAVLIAAVGCTFTSADNGNEKDLPKDDIGEDVSESDVNPDNPGEQEDDDPAELDSTERASGMTIETYDSQEFYDMKRAQTKPYIMPINTERGVKDYCVHIKTDGDRLLGVSEFLSSPDNNGLSIISSGRDYIYLADSAQIYYFNVTTGECKPLIPDSYGGYSRQEFLDYFAGLYKKVNEITIVPPEMKYWLNCTKVSSDGKWLCYVSSKWTEGGKISAKDHLWLHNIETGEELICDDLLADTLGESAVFTQLMSDNKLLASYIEQDGTRVHTLVDIVTRETENIYNEPKNTFFFTTSDKYIITFNGDLEVYDITTGKIHSFDIGATDCDFNSLSFTQCSGDCLAIAPKPDAAYVIDLVNDRIDKFTPPDARYTIRVKEVYEGRVCLDVIHKSSSELFGNFIVNTGIVTEPIDYDTELKLYSRHVEYSMPEYQRFIPEVYDLTPIYEILGEEAADRATAEYYKLDMNERQSIPPLYRLLRDTGITREQLEAYNKAAENKLSDEVIEALYYPYDEMVCEALIGSLGMFCDGKAFSFYEAIHYLTYRLPGNSGMAFFYEVMEHSNGTGTRTYDDNEAVHDLIMSYLEAFKAGELPDDYPVVSTIYNSYYIGEKSYNKEPNAISAEVCDPTTEQGVARWQQINRENAYAAYYLPITIDGKTADCEIKTAMMGTGKIADISYRSLSGGLRIFGEGTRGCYVVDDSGRSIYRFDLATAECTPILSLAESGYFIEDPTHYDHIPGENYSARYALQVSPDGKWLLYRSDKWLKQNIRPSEEYHTWLHNLETGEELLFDDIVIYATGYEKQFEYLLADNKILVSGEDSDGSLCYSVVDIFTKNAEKILTVPRDMQTFAASPDYIFYFTDRETTQAEVYGIADGSTHRFRFSSPIVRANTPKCLGKCLAFKTHSGIVVMNLECDTAISLNLPKNIESGSTNYEIISDQLVLIDEFASGYNDFRMNIAVWTGLERVARDTSLAGRLYGRHVEYTAKEYQKFIPEVYDLTPIYEILGEEKAAAAIADYYSLICEERLALPPLYRLLHGMEITKEQLKKYNETAENKLPDDVIEALYLDWMLVSSKAERVKKALLGETSLFYDGYAYSLSEAISANLPYDVMAEYLGSVEEYVKENCSSYWINILRQEKEYYDDEVTAANSKTGETIYSFNKTAVQGDKTVDYRIDVVCTGRDGNQSSDEFSTDIWGEFELRAFDKDGKQTGSVRLEGGLPGNRFVATGINTENLSVTFDAITAENIIIFSSPYYSRDDAYISSIYGITFSGELFMYEIEDSDDFIYTNSNPGGGSQYRISANTIIESDLYSYIRPNFKGDSPDAKYLRDSYVDYDIRQISFYQIDAQNRKIIPKIFVNGYYSADIVDSVISGEKPNADDALYVKTSESEAYVYYIAGWLYPYDNSGVYYRKTVMDENGEWHAVGDTMRVKTQADIAKWFEPFGGNAG